MLNWKININKQYKAFTLIELLIVIAIIGILASVVLVSTNAARNKAKDAIIIQSAKSMAQAAAIDGVLKGYYDDWYQGETRYNQATNTGGFFSTEAECDASFENLDAQIAASAREACKSIVKASGHTGNGMDSLFMGTWTIHSKLTIAAYLPGAKKVFCIGSSGKSSMLANADGSGCGADPSAPYEWTCPGCTGNN